MTYELALISVLIGAGYWGQFFLRRRPHGTATFGLMQLGAAALAGLGLLDRKYDVPPLGILGAIGVGAGVCLLVLGPIVRVTARRFAAAERIGIATRLLDVAEILAPGSGVAEEKALLGAMREIREGRIEQTVDALTAAKERAPAEARLAIDERIAMLYLAAYRWSDAIAHAEAHLFGAAAALEREPAERDSLRGALGIAPPVWVELLGAYGRTGDLDRAATMLARLEDVCADRADAALWIHRARLMFLALAGRPDSVRALVAPRRSRHMSAAARSYWVAVAEEHKGDRTAAIAAYEKARAKQRGRPRDLIDQALAKLADPTALPGAIGSLRTTAIATGVIARVEAAPLPAPIRMPRTRGPWATTTLALALLAASATIALAVGGITDIGDLIRGGALVRGMVDDGEWWRFLSSLFVHDGTLHLVLNVTGLYIIGRVAEELFGGARTVAVFAAAGLGGGIASYLASPVGISVGASGAVFGLLGAVFVEISWHRRRYRSTWRRGLWGGLAVVTVAQLAYGFAYPSIDQWAHGGGLVAGALIGAALSPHARWARYAKHAARGIALVFGVVVLWAAVMVARTSLADSIERTPPQRRVVGELAVTAPASWEVVHGGLYEPDDLVTVRFDHAPRGNIGAQVAIWIAEQARHSKDELGDIATADTKLVTLPDGWEGSELVATPEDAMGYKQKLRIVMCARPFGDTVILVAIQAPDTLVRAAPAFFARLIASVGPAT